MKKLIEGIVEFRQTARPDYAETFARLALGQAPDSLFIACSDSRVVPNLFASTNPGDLFVIRNVGNIIPPVHRANCSCGIAEAAALEFSIETLNIKDIIVCGHSECGAMQAITKGIDTLEQEHLKEWLKNSEISIEMALKDPRISLDLSHHNKLSQFNVLKQIDHLKNYPLVKKKIEEGTLNIHGWYFDIAHADVYAFEEVFNRFVLIDEEESTRIIKRLGRHSKPS